MIFFNEFQEALKIVWQILGCISKMLDQYIWIREYKKEMKDYIRFVVNVSFFISIYPLSLRSAMATPPPPFLSPPKPIEEWNIRYVPSSLPIENNMSIYIFIKFQLFEAPQTYLRFWWFFFGFIVTKRDFHHIEHLSYGDKWSEMQRFGNSFSADSELRRAGTGTQSSLVLRRVLIRSFCCFFYNFLFVIYFLQED